MIDPPAQLVSAQYVLDGYAEQFIERGKKARILTPVRGGTQHMTEIQLTQDRAQVQTQVQTQGKVQRLGRT